MTVDSGSVAPLPQRDHLLDLRVLAEQFLYISVGVDPSFELADAGARPFAGSWMILTFGLLEVIVMLNLLIAIISNTFERVNTSRKGIDYQVKAAKLLLFA